LIGSFIAKSSDDWAGVKYIKVSKNGRDQNGNNVNNFFYLNSLSTGNTIRIAFDDLGVKEFEIESKVEYSTYFTYYIKPYFTPILIYGSNESLTTQVNTSASVTFREKLGSSWKMNNGTGTDRNFVSLQTLGAGSTTDKFYYFADPQLIADGRVYVNVNSMYYLGSLNSGFAPRFNSASIDYDWDTDSGEYLAFRYQLKGTTDNGLYNEPLYPTTGYLIKISGSLNTSSNDKRSFRFFAHTLRFYNSFVEPDKKDFVNYINHIASNPIISWTDSGYGISPEIIIQNSGYNSFETSFVYAGLIHGEDLINDSLIFGVSSSIPGGNTIYNQDFHKIKLDIQPITASYGLNNNPLNIIYDLPEGSPLDIIIEPYFPQKFQNTDCDVLAGNAKEARESTFYMDVDYAEKIVGPVNQDAIIQGTAVKAKISDSNYTLARHINPRYKGSRTTSKDINVWDDFSEDSSIPVAVNTYGKLPTIDSLRTYYVYFDYITSLDPELKNKSLIHIKYLVDEEGNKIIPNDYNLYITQNTFKQGESALLNLDDTRRFEVPMDILNGYKNIYKGGQRVDIILHSDSGSTYNNTLYFDTGSIKTIEYGLIVRRTSGLYNISSHDVLLYNWNQTNKTPDPIAATWNPSTELYTFNADTQVPVKFIVNVDATVIPGNTVGVYIMKNYDTVNGVGINKNPLNPAYYESLLDYEEFTNPLSSDNDNYNFILRSSYQNFETGDTVCVVIRNVGSSMYLNTKNKDYFTAVGQLNSTGSISISLGGDYWTTGSLSTEWITASSDLSNSYGLKQLDMIPYDGLLRDIEFNPIINNFLVETGNEIRFEGEEIYSRMIKSIILPQDNNQGLLYLELNAPVPSGSNINHFLIRKYVDDASYIIIETKKPTGTTSPGTFKPKFITNKLKIAKIDPGQISSREIEN
jgi:hypothetical protein